MTQTNLLLAKMKLKGITAQSLADVQNWGKSTVYRKINGKSDFTAPEIQVCADLLALNAQEITDIFFTVELSLKDNTAAYV